MFFVPDGYKTHQNVIIALTSKSIFSPWSTEPMLIYSSSGMSARTMNPQSITVGVVLGRGEGAAAGDALPAASVAVEDAPHQPRQQHRLLIGACTAAAGAVLRTRWALGCSLGTVGSPQARGCSLPALLLGSADILCKSHTAKTTGRCGSFFVVSGKFPVRRRQDHGCRGIHRCDRRPSRPRGHCKNRSAGRHSRARPAHPTGRPCR